MNKVKQNGIAKFIAGFLLAVSVLASIAGGIMIAVYYEAGAFTNRDGLANIEEEEVKRITQYNYEFTALRYYEQYISDEPDMGELSYYRDYFSESKTNYSFEINMLNDEGLASNDDSPYTLISYEPADNYRYRAVSIRNLEIPHIKTISYTVYTDEEYEEKITELEEEYESVNVMEYTPINSEYVDHDYNRIPKRLKVECINYDYYEVQLVSRVRENLTADDAYAESFVLNHADFIRDLFDVVIPITIISIIVFFASFAFIIASAGHTLRSGDEIELTAFDKIPYDIILAFCLGVELIVGMLCYETYTEILYIIPFAIGSVMLPVLLYTTAARLKAGTLIKKTLTFKFLSWCLSIAGKAVKWCLSIAGRAFRWLFGSIGYLFKNMNLCIKTLGIFAVISFFELIGIMSMDNGTIAVFWFLEKLVLTPLILLSVINMRKIKDGTKKIADGDIEHAIETDKLIGDFKTHAEDINRVRDGIETAVGRQMKSEHMKTELITNVSHDIKTPLTSIINYVDLLGKEDLNNEKAAGYLEVLNRQSARLKKLIQDLIDASKATTGNIEINLAKTNAAVLLEQALGEYAEQYEKKGIEVIINNRLNDMSIMADGKLLWRAFDNLLVNISKYAQENTRVYIDLQENGNTISITFKNTSRSQLNISGDELMERFVRGDSSRNTEGSGLGLSIAKSLMENMGGSLEILVDGDLFKVVLSLVKA